MSDVEPIMFRPGGQQGDKPGGPGAANKSTPSSLTPIQDKVPGRHCQPGQDTRRQDARRQDTRCQDTRCQGAQPPTIVCFDRLELNQILNLYGRKVASGDWRDYAIDFGRERAVFSVFARASECPLYRIEKSPKLARKQGAYAVVSAHGLILKRGRDLRRVLGVLDKSLRLVEH